MKNYLSILLILFIFSCKSPIDPTNSLFQYIAGVDIREDIEERKLYFGTGNGIKYINFNDTSLSIKTFTSNDLPIGGNTATIFTNNLIVTSYIKSGTDHPTGEGIYYANINDDVWINLYQPMDLDSSETFITTSWGDQNIQSMAITTVINNVTYDLSIIGDYIYSAGWASGIRRYNYINNENWEIIPLPLDSENELVCGNINLNTYKINPLDPINGGNHNHKGFSVYHDGEFIWVGTANGINRGTIRNECIDWVHFKSTTHNISGNWVIGFTHQENNTHTRLWAITWSAEMYDFNALSYTDNAGETWESVMPAGIPEKVYNLYSDSSSVWASTESGLYYTFDQLSWNKIESPYGKNQSILTSIRAKNDFNAIWIGTEYGFARTYNLGNSWELFSMAGDINYWGYVAE